MKCGDCKNFLLFWFCDPEDPDEMGECTYPVGPLPYAWRYARRDVMSVTMGEEIECARFEPRGDAPIKQEPR